MSSRPDLTDRLIPLHAEADNSEMSPDSTGFDQLTDDVNNSLNVQDSQSSGLVGKFRSSLKKKISIKGVSGFVKTPPRPAPRRTKEEDGERERTEEEEGEEERSPELEKSENVDDIEIERSGEEIRELHETVESTPEGGVEVKKKKKKKRRPREEEMERQETEVVESTPVKRTGVGELPDFAESPVVSVETEEVSHEVTTSSSGKTKKTKRRTHKKTTTTQQIDGDDGEQVF